MAPELYCLVPLELADELLEPLRHHFDGSGIQVIVERRDPRNPPAFALEHQRRRHLPRALGDLPEAARPHASALHIVQRMAPAGPALVDLKLMEVVRLAATGDGLAATELSWRIYARVESRVHAEHVDAALGRVLDTVGNFPGGTETQFYTWLDATLQPPAMAGRMTSVSPSDTLV
jgi:hypothetical protein